MALITDLQTIAATSNEIADCYTRMDSSLFLEPGVVDRNKELAEKLALTMARAAATFASAFISVTANGGDPDDHDIGAALRSSAALVMMYDHLTTRTRETIDSLPDTDESATVTRAEEALSECRRYFIAAIAYSYSISALADRTARYFRVLKQQDKLVEVEL